MEYRYYFNMFMIWQDEYLGNDLGIDISWSCQRNGPGGVLKKPCLEL